MLSTKLLFLAFCAIFALTLVGSGTAHPIDASTAIATKDNITTTPAARKWGYGPYACTDQNFFCLVIEKAHFHGWQQIHCNPHHTFDTGNFQTFFFDGRCEGQMIMACPNRDGSPHSGLVDFHLGVQGLTSSFFTNDINVKGVTSDLQSVLAATGKVTVKAAWGDLQVTCRY